MDQTVAAIRVTGPVSRFRPETHVTSVKAAAAGVWPLLRGGII